MVVMDSTKDGQDDFSSNIPIPWKGLFKSLSKRDRQTSQNAADLWYQTEAMSLYGSRPEWAELLQCLSKAEPVMKDKQLLFLPYFCHLNTDVQNNLLLFLLKYRDMIQSNILSSFLESLHNALPPDSWVEAYYRMLRAHLMLETDDGKVNVCAALKNIKPEELVYKFSTKNAELFNSVKQTLCTEKDHEKIWKSDSTNLANKDSTQVQKVEVPIGQSESTYDDDVNCVKENKVSDLPGEKAKEDVIMILDDDEDDILVEPPAKKQKVDEDKPKETEMGVGVVISQELKANIEKLQECWKSGSASEIPTELELLYTSTKEQMEQICKILSQTTADEGCLSTACRHLATISDVITHESCVLFLSYNVLPQFSSLQHTASRVFTSTVLLLSEKYPKPLIDGVIIPCIKRTKFGSPQLDVATKVIRDVLSDSNKVQLLRCLSSADIILDDHTVAVYQAVIESKTLLDIDKCLVNDILIQYQSSTKLQKSLKFGKLLLAFLNKYGIKMAHEHLEVVSDIVNSHRTFMKKTLEANLKTLKTRL